TTTSAKPVVTFKNHKTGYEISTAVKLQCPNGESVASLLRGTVFEVKGKIFANSLSLELDLENILCDLYFEIDGAPQHYEVSDKKPFVQFAPDKTPIDLSLAEIQCLYREDKK
ncbi:hypothetical protein BUE80_DR008868, partial [Diplocarpon rosae]